ncbi:methyltransferase [Sphingomonas sp. FW199]|uniref:methyltransferase n=1 Tax=Sphingomonas sp. FW199 TaxID=3400217 RepID=UPI003CEFB063
MSSQPYTLNWRTRWALRRNAVLGSLGFQRWAARVPIVRAVARRRAAAQFDLVAGFVYSQLLAASVESGLIDLLRGTALTGDAIASRLGLGAAATDRLLRGCRALKLVEEPQPGLWVLGEEGAPLSANAGAMAMIRHHRILYRDLADPMALLRADRTKETALSAFWSYAAKDGAGQTGDAADYSELMAATQAMIAEQALAAYPFSRHRRMLDIGGGSGSFALAVADAAPALMLGIFDLPPVAALAQARIAALPQADRFSIHPGSFRDDALPHGYDLITLIRIAHDHDDSVVAALFSKIHAALPPGGRLLIVEPMARVASAERMGDAYFGLYLWAMGQGRPRSERELTAMLTASGFASVQSVPTALPLITSAIVATR